MTLGSLIIVVVIAVLVVIAFAVLDYNGLVGPQ